MAATTRSHWSISSVRSASVSLMNLLFLPECKKTFLQENRETTILRWSIDIYYAPLAEKWRVLLPNWPDFDCNSVTIIRSKSSRYSETQGHRTGPCTPVETDDPLCTTKS